MSPTKKPKAKGDSGKEPKWMEKKTPDQFSSGQRANSVWLWFRQHYRSEVRLDWNIQNIIQFNLVKGLSHHSGMETGLLRIRGLHRASWHGLCWHFKNVL